MRKLSAATRNSLRQELLRVIAADRERGWASPPKVMLQLETFGDDLIPSLIASLNDDDVEVRILAAELLTEARSEEAMLPMIEQLSHYDRLFLTALAVALARFGPKASAAIPFIEPWLQEENESLRATAVTALKYLDPTRQPSELPEASAAAMKYRRLIGPAIASYFESRLSRLP